MGITWVLADYRDHKVSGSTLENIVFAQSIRDELGHTIVVLVPGPADDADLESLKDATVDRIVILDHPSLANYTPAKVVSALERFANDHNETPEWILCAHTHRYYDLVPRLAVRFGGEPLAGVIGAQFSGGRPVFQKPVFFAKYNANLSCEGKPPHVISIQPGTFSEDDLQREGSPILEHVPIHDLEEGRRRPIRMVQPERSGVDITTADIVVTVGRGIGKKENLELVRELADKLGAALGSSRPIVDAGWLPYEHQIGSSGVTVTPKLYIGVGVSGAMQHTVGMKNAKVIVAINKDREAPIFKLAHYGIVGDLFTIVPALVKRLEQEQASKEG